MGSGANRLVLFDDLLLVSMGSGANLRGCLGASCSDMTDLLAVAESPLAFAWTCRVHEGIVDITVSRVGVPCE